MPSSVREQVNKACQDEKERKKKEGKEGGREEEQNLNIILKECWTFAQTRRQYLL